MERDINSSTLYTLNKDTSTEEVFSEKGSISAKIRDWEAPVSLKILIGVGGQLSPESDTKPFNINGSKISIVESDLGFVTMSVVLVLLEDCGLGLRVVIPVGLASSLSNFLFNFKHSETR